MSDIHVLTSNLGRGWKVAFHIDVPNTNNDVGLNYRTVLISSGMGGTTILPDGDGTGGTISAAEKTSIENGEVFELVSTYSLESGGTTNTQLRDSLREFYAAEETRLITSMKHRLRYFGHTESRV